MLIFTYTNLRFYPASISRLNNIIFTLLLVFDFFQNFVCWILPGVLRCSIRPQQKKTFITGKKKTHALEMQTTTAKTRTLFRQIFLNFLLPNFRTNSMYLWNVLFFDCSVWRFRNYQRTPNRMLTRRLPDTKWINASPRIRLHASIRLKSEKRKIIKCKVANEKRSRQN